MANKVIRPWGSWCTIKEEGTYKVKLICVDPSKRLSLQSHNYRSEHWVIVEGKVKVRVEDDEHELNVNQSIYIPKGVKHRLENIGKDVAKIIETQIGSYLEEDDIKRYDDDFGRV